MRKCSGAALNASSISCSCGRKMLDVSCVASDAEVLTNFGEVSFRVGDFLSGSAETFNPDRVIDRRQSTFCRNFICYSFVLETSLLCLRDSLFGRGDYR